MADTILIKGETKTLPAGRQAPVRVFLAAVVFMFFCSLSAADSVGFVPCSIDGSCTVPHAVALSSLPELGDTPASAIVPPKPQGVVPVHITIDAVGIDLPIQNPATRDIDTLDALLEKGPARYVDSALLGEAGNMVIFAHSSHLPIVHNKMYQAFNKIPDLKTGDPITIEGKDGTSYLYRVERVAKADVEDGVTINLSTSQGTKLTLVTCDTLTGKSARYVLEAQFVGTI